MTVKRLLQIITVATVGGVAAVLVLVVLMGRLAQEKTDRLTGHDMALLDAVNRLYSQGLQSAQAVRNVVLNPNDDRALQNYWKADTDFLLALGEVEKYSYAKTDTKLAEVGRLWQEIGVSRERVLALVKAGNLEAASRLLSEEDTPKWREIKTVILERLAATKALFSKEGDEFAQQVRSGVAAVGGVMLFSLAVIVLAVHFTYRKIAYPLDDAVRFAHVIAKGDLSPADLKIRANDEIGKLTASLNRMKAALQDLFDQTREKSRKLEELNRSLEQKVDKRTEELKEKNRKLEETLVIIGSAQEQLIEAEKMASLGSLVAGVAHEINTPVGIGVTAASHLQERTRHFAKQFQSAGIKKSDLESYLETAEQSSTTILANLQRAADLIASFKRVAVSQSSEDQELICLRAYTQEILTSLWPQLKKTRLKTEIECPEDLCIHTLPGAFSQIVTNLVINAILHAYEPEERGTLRLRFAREGKKRVRFIFSDDGKGIAPEVLPKIFDPFFTTKRGQGGSGLGLNIIYNIATQSLGGSIRCESALGQGTTFTIVLKDQG